VSGEAGALGGKTGAPNRQRTGSEIHHQPTFGLGAEIWSVAGWQTGFEGHKNTNLNYNPDSGESCFLYAGQSKLPQMEPSHVFSTTMVRIVVDDDHCDWLMPIRTHVTHCV